MLEHTERRLLRVGLGRVAQALPTAVRSGANVHLVPVPLLGEAGASAWEGQAPIGAWGLAPTIWTRIAQASEGTTHLEMRFGVAAGNKLVVVGLLLLVFCCPVAVVCGYLAYRDFERRKESALRAVWGHLGHLTGVPAEPMAASTVGR